MSVHGSGCGYANIGTYARVVCCVLCVVCVKLLLACLLDLVMREGR